MKLSLSFALVMLLGVPVFASRAVSFYQQAKRQETVLFTVRQEHQETLYNVSYLIDQVLLAQQDVPKDTYLALIKKGQSLFGAKRPARMVNHDCNLKFGMVDSTAKSSDSFCLNEFPNDHALKITALWKQFQGVAFRKPLQK